jgi:hypothetical protein
VKASAALALVLGLCTAGCSNYHPISQQQQSHASIAQLVAVTLPDSLGPGAPVDLAVQWYPVDCHESFLRFDVSTDARGRIVVVPRTWIRVDDTGCLASSVCDLVVSTIRLQVPDSGSTEVLIGGAYGAIDLRLAPHVAPGPGHVVQVIARASSGYPDSPPVPGLNVDLILSSPWQLIERQATDSLGYATFSSHCSPDSAGTVYLWVEDPEWGCGVDLLRCEGALSPCGRAFRTILLHGPKPSTMYSREPIPASAS